MYNLLSLFSGILVSAMIVFNGGLTRQYGVYSATVIIHVVGLILISCLLLTKRGRPLPQKQAWYLYLGGALGVATTVFNNFAFGRISVSAILALGLMGQSVTGLIVDQFGLMKMPRHPFHKSKIIGILLILAGTFSMTEGFDAPAVFASLLGGVLLVISRTLNARLADGKGIRASTFYNYLIGLAVAVPVCALLGGNEPLLTTFSLSPEAYIYLGGAAGVCVVLLSNLTVAKVSAFYYSLFLFIGQVFSGILLDALISQAFSPRNLIGGILVAAGLCVNLLLDRKYNNLPMQTGDAEKLQPVRKRRISNTVFSSRPEHAIVCPSCGTAQSREEDRCRSCGIGFVFLDETNRFCM
jgi:transporter family-2 protein